MTTNELIALAMQSPPYRGCGAKMIGTLDTLRHDLNDLAMTGKWFAEPKLDGNWVIAIGQGPQQSPALINRSGNRIDDPEFPPLAEGYALVGEQLIGTASALAIRSKLGHPQIIFFDLLNTPAHGAITHHPLAYRKARLSRATLQRPEQGRAFYRIAPTWQDDFAAHFLDETCRNLWPAHGEGLVLKLGLDGPYTPGKPKTWIKVKQCATYSTAIYDWQPSLADTKKHRNMAATVRVCQWFYNTPADPAITSRLLPHYLHCNGKVAGIRSCGKITLGSFAWCQAIAQDPAWLGAIVDIAAYKQFTSGKFRHPTMATLDPKRRFDLTYQDLMQELPHD